jgi:hypothetical protein
MQIVWSLGVSAKETESNAAVLFSSSTGLQATISPGDTIIEVTARAIVRESQTAPASGATDEASSLSNETCQTRETEIGDDLFSANDWIDAI